jgi:hypothetical protein
MFVEKIVCTPVGDCCGRGIVVRPTMPGEGMTLTRIAVDRRVRSFGKCRFDFRVCGGVFILAKTGLLSGRQATTHWALREQFAVQFPNVLTESDHTVIDHGDVVTAGGVLAWA